MCVCLSTGSPHVTTTHDELGPNMPPNTRHGTYPLLLTSGGHHWRPVQTCTPEELPPHQSDIYWRPPKHVPIGKRAACILLECFLVVYYHPQRSWGKVMFLHLSIILLTGRVCLSACWDTPPSWADTAPRQTPPWAHTPLGRHPPVQCMLGYGRQAVHSMQESF